MHVQPRRPGVLYRGILSGPIRRIRFSFPFQTIRFARVGEPLAVRVGWVAVVRVDWPHSVPVSADSLRIAFVYAAFSVVHAGLTIPNAPNLCWQTARPARVRVVCQGKLSIN